MGENGSKGRTVISPRGASRLSALRMAPWLNSPLRSCLRARSLTRMELEMHLLVDSSPSMSLAGIFAHQSGAASGPRPISSRGPDAPFLMSWTSRPEFIILSLSNDHYCDLYFYNLTRPQK